MQATKLKSFRLEHYAKVPSILISSSRWNSSKGSNSSSGGSNNALPENVEEINASHKAKFSPHRTRDASGARLDIKLNQPGPVFGASAMGSQGASCGKTINTKSVPVDSHIDVYDAHNSVSLSSVMQSNVPQPYDIQGKKAPSHLNMPGGHWAQGEKYVSGELQEHHYLKSNNKKNRVD